MGGAERHQAFGTTSNEADDSSPDTERDGDDDGLQDVPANGWEEFDPDGVYQDKHVSPDI